MTFIL